MTPISPESLVAWASAVIVSNQRSADPIRASGESSEYEYLVQKVVPPASNADWLQSREDMQLLRTMAAELVLPEVDLAHREGVYDPVPRSSRPPRKPHDDS